MDIYSILASKPHNPHYLNRYITFIEQCQQKNVGYDGYTENHHICPKAKDMFPGYVNFKKHPWNKAELTARQHFIAHLILWKTFPAVKSTSKALKFMSDNTDKWGYVLYSKTYEKLKLLVSEYMVEHRKNNIWVNNGEQEFFIQKDSLNTNSFLKGRLEFRKRCVMINNGYENKMHDTNEDIPQGWELGIYQELFYANNGTETKRVSKLPDGWELGGVKNRYKWINDGVLERKIDIYEEIPFDWKLGRIPNSTKKKLISNGIIEMQIDINENIPEGWVYGSIETYKKGKKIIITNGIEDRKIGSNEYIPEGWYKGTTRLCKNKGTSGKIMITNGTVDTWISKDENIPKGWQKGSHRKSQNKHKFWITDGSKNKRIGKDEKIPEGWYKGFTQLQEKTMNITDGKNNKKINPKDKIPEGWHKGNTIHKK
jgi:hypothetical protein